MNSIERVLRVMGHKETDRVPIIFDASDEIYMSLYEHLGMITNEHLFNIV